MLLQSLLTGAEVKLVTPPQPRIDPNNTYSAAAIAALLQSTYEPMAICATAVASLHGCTSIDLYHVGGINQGNARALYADPVNVGNATGLVISNTLSASGLTRITPAIVRGF